MFVTLRTSHLLWVSMCRISKISEIIVAHLEAKFIQQFFTLFHGYLCTSKIEAHLECANIKGGMTSRQSVVVLELAQFAVIEFGECEEFVGER